MGYVAFVRQIWFELFLNSLEHKSAAVCLSVLALLLLAPSLSAVTSVYAQRDTILYVNNSASVGSDTNCSSPGYTSIASAVSAATSGDTILVCAGTYQEQVAVATSGVTIQGSGTGTTVIKPASVSQNTVSIGTPLDAIIFVKGASNVVVEDLTVDGSQASSSITGCSPGFTGILYQDSSGNVSNTHVRHIELASSLLSCQMVAAVDVESGSLSGVSTTSSSVHITSNVVGNYQKTGIACSSTGSSCTITGNTVTGLGLVTGLAAQNGIRLANGATGSVSSNTVSANTYNQALNTGSHATGIFIYDAAAGGVTVTGNTLSNNDLDIFYQGSPESEPVSSNTIQSGYVIGMIFIDTTNVVSSNSISQSQIGLLAFACSADTTVYSRGNTFSGSVTTDTSTTVNGSPCSSYVATITTPPSAASQTTSASSTSVVIVLSGGAGTGSSGGVTVTYSAVTGAGTTSVSTSSSPSQGSAPSGYVTHGAFFDASTTATFTGAVTLCFTPTAGSVDSSTKLLHYQSGAWADVTTSVDTATDSVCGSVTSLSPFAIVDPSPPSVPEFPFPYAMPLVFVAAAAIYLMMRRRGSSLPSLRAGRPVAAGGAGDPRVPSIPEFPLQYTMRLVFASGALLRLVFRRRFVSGGRTDCHGAVVSRVGSPGRP